MDNSGYIKLHRKFLEWEWYDDINCKVLFIHCLIKANYRDKQWRGKTIQRGQFFTSIDNLTDELHLSPQQIRTSLSKLETTKEIVKKSTNEGTYITICNYDNYQQLNQTDQQTDNKPITNDQQTDNKRITTTKEYKEKKEIKNNKEVIGLYNSIVIFFDEELRPKTEAQKNSWLDCLDKLIRIDGHTPDEIRDVVKRTRMDDFWRPNFLSITKLRNTNKDGVKYFMVFKNRFSQGKSFGIPDKQRDYETPQTEF